MLSDLLKSHQQKQQQQKVIQAERRKEAVAASQKLTSALVDHLNVSMAEAYVNQRRVDAEARQLHAHVTRLSQQSRRWLQLSAAVSTTLKELGDVENWARCVQSDLTLVADTLQTAYTATHVL